MKSAPEYERSYTSALMTIFPMPETMPLMAALAPGLVCCCCYCCCCRRCCCWGLTGIC